MKELDGTQAKETMNCQHDALYRAICQSPDEDTPRLAYADLIEEEGDDSSSSMWGGSAARAAFIRTQIALARADEFDPLHASTRQLKPDAFVGHSMAHTLPKRLPPGCNWSKFEFRRGFPWKVGVQSLQALAGDDERLLSSAPIQALSFLELDKRDRADLPALADWKQLARIERLEFSSPGFSAEAIARLANSPYGGNIRELAFEREGMDVDGLVSLTRSPLLRQLRSLELNSIFIPSALIVDALAAYREPRTLARLSLRDSRIDSRDAFHLFSLPLLQGLHALDLSENPELGVAGVQALADSRAMRGLKVLNLSETRPGVPGIRHLVERSAPSSLKSLDLSSNRLGPVAVGWLVQSAAASGLRMLDLSGNPIQDAGAKALANAESLSGLLELNLADASLTDEGARALADSQHLDGLLRLNLTNRTSPRSFNDKTRRMLVERFGQCVSC